MDDLRKALFRALKKSDVNMLRAVMAQGVPLAVQPGDPSPVFLDAINSNRNDLDILDMLLAAGADPAARFGPDGANALHWVVGRERPDTLNWFLSHGLDVNAAMHDGTTPLMSAIISADWQDAAQYAAGLRDVRLLLAAGADVSLRDADMGTALHSAAARGFTDIVLLLLEHGAAIDARDGNGETPLLRAASAGQAATVASLLSHGADASVQAARGFGALHDLASQDSDSMTPERLDIAEQLINAGADVDAADDDGLTALCWAAASNNPEMTRILLRHGARTDIRCGHALREAIFFEYGEIVDALLAAGAGINIPGKDHGCDWGDVPLTIAAHENYVHGLTALLDHGADIEAQTNDGETALLVAVRRGNGAAVDLLLGRGANRGHIDRYGNTAQSLATRRRDTAMLERLN